MHVSRSVPKASTSHLCAFFHFKLSTWRQSMAQFLQGDTSAGKALRHGLRMMFAQDSQDISPVVQSPKRV